MVVLPIVDRELRVVARRPSTQWVRFLASLLAVLLLLMFMDIGPHSLQAKSKDIFVAMASVAFVFSILAGVFLTADALSSEKREGTLGLLFLTDLHGYDVVLGKLMVSSVHSLYALLAIFPILGIPLLMGGVTGAEFIRVMGALVVTLCFSLGTGLLISAIGREMRQVTLGTFLVILLFGGLSPALYFLLKVLTSMRVSRLLMWFSPGVCLNLAYDENYMAGPFLPEYWWCMTVILFVSFVFIGLACYYLPNAWQERSLISRRPSASQKPSGLSGAGCKRPPLRDLDPFLWLGSRDASAGKLAWLGVILMLPLETFFIYGSIFGLKNSAFGWRYVAMVGMFCGFGAHQLLKYLVAVEASRRLSEDRSSGALELVLASPVSEPEVLSGLRTAVRVQFAGPVGCVALANLCLAAMVFTRFSQLQMSEKEVPTFLLIFGGGAMTLILDCWALSWVGQWRGLRAKNPNRALSGTLARVMGVSWLGLALMCFVVTHSNAGDGASTMAFWTVFGLMVAAVAGGYARERVSRGIRSALELK